MDGEIVCLDAAGRSVFDDLLFRRGTDCYFYAFDLLFVDGEDVRNLPLIVAKRKDSLYRATEKPSPHGIKIKNPNYSQAEGRQDMFEELTR